MSKLEGARSAIPVPRPLSEAVEVPLPKSSGPLRPLAVHAIHHTRTMLYIPVLLAMLARQPKNTIAGMAIYWGMLSHLKQWQRAMTLLIAYGSSNKPRWINAMRTPTYDASKQYLMTTHPHGMLCCGVFNGCARAEPEFKFTGECSTLLPGLKFVLCFAPAVGWFPVHSELYGKHITDASGDTVRKVLKSGYSAAVCPGGFSESVYTGADVNYDYAYLVGRVGFIKLAIEHGIDIAPMYTFGMNGMYRTSDYKRHERSVWSQRSGLPALLPWGWMGTSVPYSEEICTVLLDPFPTSRYTLDQLEQCSEDYAAYMEACFKAYKHCLPGHEHRRLLFIGKDSTPQKVLSQNPLASRL